jgi:hypothetical protein
MGDETKPAILEGKLPADQVVASNVSAAVPSLPAFRAAVDVEIRGRIATGHNVRMTDIIPVLTIDGPSGSGKGTISRFVAQRLGWHYLDSGALYRAVGVSAGWEGIDLDDHAAWSDAPSIPPSSSGRRRPSCGSWSTAWMRPMSCAPKTAGAAASAIAAIPEVRPP